VLAASPWWALPLIALLLWRARPTPQASAGFAWTQRVWSPHAATCVIGVAFVVLLLAAGAWTYTDVLAELARGMFGMLNSRLALAIALLAGAALGGWSAGRWQPTSLRPTAVLRCLAGGALMACGSLLIPGGNDGLILLGMPLLWPYAWLAFATMCASIAVAMGMLRRIGSTQ
jgi:toxin CptA